MTLDNVIDIRPEGRQEVGARTVDVRRGSVNGALSAQWFSRPDDQRFTSLDDLFRFVSNRAERSWADTVDTRSIQVLADQETNEMTFVAPGDRPMLPTHWAFGQVCTQIKAPAGYLRTLPSSIAQFPVQYGLIANRQEVAKFYVTEGEGDDDVPALRAVTSPTYGRIMDAEVVKRVMNIAGDDWKVPGTIDWRTMQHDPNTPITKSSTTLYASDRDVFIFLCQDQYPIEVGKLPNGEPDMLFPAFIVSNSETGSGALYIEQMFLRGVCQNRNLWGVEDSVSTRIRHTRLAPERLDTEAGPALRSFVETAATGVREKALAAQNAIVAKTDEERTEFLVKKGFSATKAGEILKTHLAEEGKPASSVWDFVQGITASARSITHQDARVQVERAAGKLMDAF